MGCVPTSEESLSPIFNETIEYEQKISNIEKKKLSIIDSMNSNDEVDSLVLSMPEEQINTLDKEKYQLSKDDIIHELKTTQEDIIEVCILEDLDIVLAISEIEHCHMRNIFSYNIREESIKRAQFLGEWMNCPSAFTSFGERDDNLITIISEFKHPGVSVSVTNHFQYNLSDNTISPIDK